MPPKLWLYTFERACLQYGYAIESPTTASLRKPMICSSVKLFFMSNLLVVKN